MRGEAPAFSRLLQLLAGLPLIIGLLVFFILSADFATRSAEQQQHFGEATAAQLSDFLAHYVIAGDILSLNVITTKISENRQVSFVAVYDEMDHLIAQSGRPEGGTTFFTNEITFQDSVIGYVRVAIPDASAANQKLLIIPAALLLALISATWLRPELIAKWLYPRPATAADSHNKKEPQPESTIIATNEAGPECFLVVRIRPAQHLARHFDQFFAAAEQFSGILEQTTPEELIIHFDGEDTMFSAASTGVLIRQLSEILQGKMNFGGTLDLAGEDSDKRRKAASYLASIADHDLLIAGGEWLLEGRATLQTFHHSLVDSEDLRRVAEIDNQDHLRLTAETLSKN